MDASRFDNLVRSLERHIPRRAALGALGGGLAALLTRAGLSDVAAKKRKKKPRLNDYGCVNVGGKCRGKDNLCCSGICQGKKPKKGKKDKSRCLAHNVLDCPAGADTCLGTVECGTNGFCYQTTGQASFCAGPADGSCVACTKDAGCESDFGSGAACVLCAGCPGGTFCIPAGV